jgi:GTP pyrophosphokinase
MDEIAEKGFAAHWKYKIGEGEEESELNVWLRTIKDILDNPEPSAIDFLDTLKLNLFASEIVVFTPKGELITLPTEATVLDLAFTLHSELGLHCIAGKVNHKLVPLNYKLSSGDQVEVLTSQTQKPQESWMDFLKTAKGKSRLRAALRRERQPLISKGNEMIADFLKRNRLPSNTTTNDQLIKAFNVESREDLCYLLGKGSLELNDDIATNITGHTNSRSTKRSLKRLLRSTYKLVTTGSTKDKADDADTRQPQEEKTVTPQKINTKETYVLRYDEHGSNFKIADCCCPIPGDEVMGFIDDDGQVVVHALNCPRALVLKAGYGPRILSTRWAVSSGKFQAHLRVEGIDRHGILQEITLMISTQMGIDLRRLDIEATGEVFHCDLWVRVEDVAVVNDLCSRLLNIDGVEHATRIQ